MGIFDGKVEGTFDRMFDLNHDVKLDLFERSIQLDCLSKMIEEDEKSHPHFVQDEYDIDYYDDDDEEDDDEYDDDNDDC